MFHNAGTFTKQGTGYAQFYNNGSNLVFNNTGTVDVQAGDLYLSSNGSHTGDFALVADTTLWLNGTHTFAATSDVSGEARSMSTAARPTSTASYPPAITCWSAAAR